MMNLDYPPPPISPTGSVSSRSDVPTEPLPASERQAMIEHMSRRQHFLSDYERYNPVQNMHMLANHVFDMTESIVHLRKEVTSNRRMIDVVSSNQLEANQGIRSIGHGLEETRDDLNNLTSQVGSMGRQIGSMDQQFGTFTTDLGSLRQDTQQQFGFMRAEVDSLRQDMHSSREELGYLRATIDANRNDMRSENASLRSDFNILRRDVDDLRKDVNNIKQEMANMRQETAAGFSELKGLILMLAGQPGRS